jgi:uncharacterized protein
VANVLLSGGSGFIGSALAKALTADGHRVARLVRGQRRTHDTELFVPWDPAAGRVDHQALERARPDVVFNLAGEPIAQRWTAHRQHAIRESRVRGTTALSLALASLPVPPAVLVNGSAIGYYGAHRGDEVLDEDSIPGSDFLARTAGDWESATAAARGTGIRVVLARTGIVLGRSGGALARMLPPFRLGVGGRLGSGRQWMSWISLEDTVRALRHLAERNDIAGPVNVVAPAPVRNEEFAKTLGSVLGRPSLIPVPAFALQLLFGTMARDTILANQRVTPKRLAGAGFEFRHPRLEDALRFELRRSGDRAGR